VRFPDVSTLLITPLPGAKNWQLRQNLLHQRLRGLTHTQIPNENADRNTRALHHRLSASGFLHDFHIGVLGLQVLAEEGIGDLVRGLGMLLGFVL
jgi:hypothetical protein